MIAKRSFYFTVVILSIFFYPAAIADQVVNDFSRLNPVTVHKVFQISSTDEIVEGLQYARENNLRVSISGKLHSQGGQASNQGGVVINTSAYNQIVAFDPAAKTIVVESGATWDQIQQHINPHGLAVKVMQSSNVFSIGGSLSVNVHGRDPRFETIAQTVLSFEMILADGTQVTVSREKNQDLFYSALGGYGLLGVITLVELSLTSNNWLEKQVTELSSKEYTDFLASSLAENTALHYARCSIVKDDGFFRNCIAVNYIEQDQVAKDVALVAEKNIWRDKLFFGLSRSFDWGKSLRWWLQRLVIDKPGKTKMVTRNNAMRPPIKFLSYYSRANTDILQEYFVPIDTAFSFIEEMREILLENDVNLLNVTLRYVPKSENVYLNYARQNVVAIVLYANIDIDHQGLEKASDWTRAIITAANTHGGVYYLAYQGFPTKQQFRDNYPGWVQFNAIKQKYDPEQLFISEFYKQYFL